MPRFYFAYGSNMDPEQFKGRCPASRLIGTAILADHRFIITSRGYASIEPCPGSVVHGVLAELTEADEASLDYHEGVQSSIYRKESLAVRTHDGLLVEAMVYVDNTTNHGQPRPGYLEQVLAGARHHGLPAEAITELERWAGRS